MILPTDDNYKQLKLLKEIGHALLDEYVSLDPIGGNRARTRAYSKLTEKMKKSYQVHFASMNTVEELITANSKLRKMVKKRRKRAEAKSKEEYADVRIVKIELDKLKRLRKGEDIV